MMDQNIKMSKTKERIEKAEQNKAKETIILKIIHLEKLRNLDSINNNLASLMEQMESQSEFIDN